MARLPAPSSAPGPSDNPPSSAPAASSSRPPRKSGSSRPLQVPVPKNTEPVRHKQFTLGEKETTGSKALSNQINNEGKPKAKACVQCLGSLSAVNETQIYGRGMSAHNEVFSCMCLNSVGVGGQQCGRCVGLGKGNECSDPPAAAEKAARDVIAAIPAYNKALLGNKKKTVGEMSEADQTAIRAAVTASKAFNGIIDGLRKQGIFTTTPSRKRKFNDFESDSKLSDLNSALTRGQSGLESKLDSLVATVQQQAAQLQDMSDTLRRLNRRSIVGRARDRWLVDGVEEVARQLNEIETHASIGRAAEDPVDVNGVEAFDLGAIDMESDHESEAEEE